MDEENDVASIFGRSSAVLNDAYAATTDDEGDTPQSAPEAQPNPPASGAAVASPTVPAQPATESDPKAPASDAAAPAGSGDTPAESPTMAQPFRVFATQAELDAYLREQVAPLTRRERAAQSAQDVRIADLEKRAVEAERKATALERGRNRVFAAAHDEEVDPRKVVELFEEEALKTTNEFAQRDSVASAARTEQARNAEVDSFRAEAAAARSESTFVVRATQIASRISEATGVKVLDPEGALHLAMKDPKVAREVRLSYVAPTPEDRTQAMEAAYELAEAHVLTSTRAIAAAKPTATDAHPEATAESAVPGAGGTASGTLDHLKTSRHALDAAYSTSTGGRRGRRGG